MSPSRDGRSVRSALAALIARPSVLLLPALAFTLFQVRALLVAHALGATGGPRIARLPHAVPGPRPLLTFALEHVQALPAVGTFLLLLIVEGAIVWRARRDAEQLGTPRAGLLADPRSLAWVWTGAMALFVAGGFLGVMLAGERPRALAFVLALPALALTQALFTAQALALFGSRERAGWAEATRASAPVLPQLIAWEAALALGFFVALRLAAIAHAPRAGTLVALAARAMLTFVPVAIVVDRLPLVETLRRFARLWRARFGAMALPLLALTVLFVLYGALGAFVESHAAAYGEASRVLAHVLLGYGVLVIHLAAAAAFLGYYRGRLSVATTP